ncbi:MAG: LysM peptidoglycan-binding domain-containing protein [Oscillospiraceae bacterium]|nr:LysM peptidoglycan-binding domain-containing protein [Oscillospiraceae bacterium]
MTIQIGHSSIDERGKAKGGISGDQTGKEVFTRNWYDGGWGFLARARDPEIAEKIAGAAAAGCANVCIGYDQNQRNTLLNRAKAVNWDLARIIKNCECDCSSFVTCCVQASGIGVWSGGNAPTTATLRAALEETGAFEILSETRYLAGADCLRRGDILVRPKTAKRGGHTVIVLSDSEPEYLIHTVVRGNSLWAIARKYLGNGNRYKEIMELNGLETTLIHAGQKLKIPKE